MANPEKENQQAEENNNNKKEETLSSRSESTTTGDSDQGKIANPEHNTGNSRMAVDEEGAEVGPDDEV